MLKSKETHAPRAQRKKMLHLYAFLFGVFYGTPTQHVSYSVEDTFGKYILENRSPTTRNPRFDMTVR